MNRFTVSMIGAASALLATPALAQDVTPGPFTGPRVGLTVGTGGDDVVDFDGQTVGLELGYDAELNGVIAGVGIEYQTDLGDDFLDVNETAALFRIGARIGTSGLVYGSGGISVLNTGSTPFNGDSETGARAGIGAEFLLGNSGTSLKIEQRYYNYSGGVETYQTVAGIGFRF
ncbi:MAG TPA: hypothetical protein VGB48_07565 [Allosphingosinicella sp.]|jgi:hypothetical protein